jgi:ribonuclease-3
MCVVGSTLYLFRCKGHDAPFYRLVRRIFGLHARNIELYKLALMHRSASVDLPDGTHLNNERLEFLGDAVLEAVVSDYLFIAFPRANEGELTRLRSKLVSRSTLNALSMAIGLDKHIIRHTGGAVQKNAGGDALEAVIGAMYLDRGYDRVTRALINELFTKHLDLQELATSETDYKSRLIEWCQRNRQQVHFSTVPDKKFTSGHPLFRSAVLIDGIELGHSVGETKKEAEQHASLAVWRVLSDDVGDQFLASIDHFSEEGQKKND